MGTFPDVVLFDSYGAMKKYESVDDIIKDFYTVRFEVYVKRKKFLEGMLEAEAERLTAQARFIVEKIEGIIVLEDKKRTTVVAKLVERGFPSDPVAAWKDAQKKKLDVVVPETDDESQSEASSAETSSARNYQYLLNMAIISLSREKKDELLKQRDNKYSELEDLRKVSPKDLWMKDLDAFLAGLEIVEEKERGDAMAGFKIKAENSSTASLRSSKTSKPRKPAAAKKQHTIEKALKKQASKTKSQKSKEGEESSSKEDWGFTSEDSENHEMLSLTERLALKKYVDTSDAASSVSSKATVTKKSGNSSETSTTSKAKKTTKAPETSDSELSVASSKAGRGRKKKTSPVKRKQATKKVTESIDTDSDSSEDSDVSQKSKPPAKKAKTTTKAKSSPVPKRRRVEAISSSDDDEDNDTGNNIKPVSPVKRPARRQKAAVKYTVDDDDDDDEDEEGKKSRDNSFAEDDWMNDDGVDDDDDDSDFDI